jgi:hypothetical protein
MQTTLETSGEDSGLVSTDIFWICSTLDGSPLPFQYINVFEVKTTLETGVFLEPILASRIPPNKG